jgi:hypothetical protein
MRDGTTSVVPRVSDDDQAGRCGVHVPGVWAAVLRARRDYSATQIWPYLGDPRLVLTLERGEYSALAERARKVPRSGMRRASRRGSV